MSDGARRRGPTVDVCRPAQSCTSCRGAAGYEPLPPVNVRAAVAKRARAACTARSLKKSALGLLPFISVLQNYQWRTWFPADIIAGISVGVLHIPQGIGFAILTSVPPVYGLYSSFFPVILYFLFGTSRHISFGTMALTSLLIGAVVDREVVRMGLDQIAENATSSTMLDDSKVGIACAVSLLVGVIQILMGVCRLGVLASFMSPSFVGGFMTGAAFHITASQLPNMLGVKIKGHGGIGRIPLIVIDIFKNIANINVASFIIGLFSVIALVGFRFANDKLKQRNIKVPIPSELIVVAVSILVSHFGKMNEKFGVRVVGDIPTGMPTPRVPPLENLSLYIGDALVIAIISFAIAITMAKIFTRKYRYTIDANQELIAYGLAHSVSSFFLCFAGTQAPPRSLVHDSSGGKSQVGSLVAALLVLLTFLVAAPLFAPLPLSALAAVIIVALLPLFLSFQNLPTTWRTNPYDAVIWVVTWTAVTFIDVVMGLAIGIGVSLLMVIAHSRIARGTAKGTLEETVGQGVYASQKTYKHAQPIRDIHIFYFPTVLYFVNVDNFKQQLFATTLDPSKMVALDDCAVEPAAAAAAAEVKVGEPAQTYDNPIGIAENGVKLTPGESMTELPLDAETIKRSNEKTVVVSVPGLRKTVIIDCAAMSYIDVMGLNLLKLLSTDYAAVGVKLVVCHCSDEMQDKLQTIDAKLIDIYPTLDDAVVVASHRRDNDTNSTKL